MLCAELRKDTLFCTRLIEKLIHLNKKGDGIIVVMTILHNGKRFLCLINIVSKREIMRMFVSIFRFDKSPISFFKHNVLILHYLLQCCHCLDSYTFIGIRMLVSTNLSHIGPW